MKVSELRIGNLIKSRKNTRGRMSDGNEIVSSIGWRSINQWQDMGASSETRDEDIEGIPLTEEWLIKFGLTKNEKHNIEYHGGILHRIGEGYNFIHMGHKMSWVQYVHHMQNLHFALTGAELTI